MCASSTALSHIPVLLMFKMRAELFRRYRFAMRVLACWLPFFLQQQDENAILSRYVVGSHGHDTLSRVPPKM